MTKKKVLRKGDIPPIIFFNIGWMKEYAGAFAGDKTIGGHGHLQKHDHGHEALNFKPFRNKMYGYIPGSGNKGIGINRLGARRSDGSISGVTVVWMARHPNQNRCLIVGWYLNAKVHRRCVNEAAAVRSLFGDKIRHLVEAQAEDCTLLPPNARNFEIPSSKIKDGGYGQSPIWYGGHDAFRTKVWRYIGRHVQKPTTARASASGRNGTGGRQHDPELRRTIEKTAIDHAITYFSSKFGGAYEIQSVETEAKGWDLEAFRDHDELLIEVKGRQGSEVSAEITPNEHEKMHSKLHRDRYVLYIVTDALNDSPIASIFRYDQTAKAWLTEDGRRLLITEKTGSLVSLI